MSEYNPDRWVMLKIISEGQTTYKILAGWSGGYTQGQSWKLNSGCTEVKEDGDYLMFSGYSGSVYRCHKDSYGMNMISSQIYNSLSEDVQRSDGVSIEVMPEETDFMRINYVCV